MSDSLPLRLFVAWKLPDDGPGKAHREAMVHLQQSIDQVIPSFSARWEPAEKLHITLRFIGEFPSERLDELVSTLGDSLSETTSFMLNFDQVLLHFGRMIWLEPSHNLELITSLHNHIDQALAPFMLKPGLRFTPHVTLARLRHNAPSRTIAGQMSPFRYPQLQPVQVRHISLMSSHFQPLGNEHHVEHEFELVAAKQLS